MKEQIEAEFQEIIADFFRDMENLHKKYKDYQLILRGNSGASTNSDLKLEIWLKSEYEKARKQWAGPVGS